MRVQLAILSLSGGSLDKLTYYAEVALSDWRDALYWSETNREESEAHSWDELQDQLGLPARVGTVTLWRPVGRKELALIDQAALRAYPPRLPEQPIFYPVLNFEYAEQIARDWNSKDPRHDLLGFVTEFDARAEVVARYEPHQVGGSRHLELWVPAEELSDFNAAIVGEIRVVARYEAGNRVG